MSFLDISVSINGYLNHLLDSDIEDSFNNSRRDTLKLPLAKISDDKIPLKDIGNKFFYSWYLLNIPTEYLILYFHLSIAFSYSEIS